MANKKKKKKAQVPFRLNILFFAVFLLFSLLVLQLGVVQILNGETFQAEIDRTSNDYSEIPVPRGKMYDRNGNLIVGNNAEYAITYTPDKGTQAQDRLDVAEKLAAYISIDPGDDGQYGLTLRNRKEYWYLENTKTAKSRLTDAEIDNMDNGEQYSTMLERIEDEEVKFANFTDQQLEIMAIKKELDKAMALTPQTIIKGPEVTSEEFARVAEHLDELPGVNATTDWERAYPYNDTFRQFAGRITSESEGILAEKEDYYLTRGYSRNDRVGRSGLEEQYESVLRGRKEKIKYTTDKNGTIVDSDVAFEGQRGKDLVLTIDMELQEKVNKVLRRELKTAIQNQPYENRYMDTALAVMMNPKTGEILAAGGQYYNSDKNKFKNAGLRTITSAYSPGSAVKGATVLAGYESGVIDPGDYFYDAPIDIKGTPIKKSYRNLGKVNDLDALRRSSNVYMFYIAMRMGGEFNYQPGKSIEFDPDAFAEMRNYFSQFGLGVSTGIDFPLESTGYEGSDPRAGNLLDLAIGQYDTYTTMQLAQYVSTIANDGYRLRPHFLKSIHNPISHSEELGPIYQTNNTEVINRVDMSEDYIQRVQEGFRQVFQESGGTATRHFANKSYKVAGKTGTAEADVYDDGEKVHDAENLALIGYAPYDEPEVAFALIVPKAGTGNRHPINHEIGKGILDAYFELEKGKEEE